MKRLPIIRHIRAIYHWHQMEKHYGFWGSLGMFPVNKHLDEDRIRRIWRGLE